MKTEAKKKTKAKPAPSAKIRHRRRANQLMTQFIPLDASRGRRVAIHDGIAAGLAEFEERGRVAERRASSKLWRAWTDAAQELYAYLHSMGSVNGVNLFNAKLRPLMVEPTPLKTWSPKQQNALALRERATNLLRKMPSHAPEGSRSWEGAIADVIEALRAGDR